MTYNKALVVKVGDKIVPGLPDHTITFANEELERMMGGQAITTDTNIGDFEYKIEVTMKLQASPALKGLRVKLKKQWRSSSKSLEAPIPKGAHGTIQTATEGFAAVWVRFDNHSAARNSPNAYVILDLLEFIPNTLCEGCLEELTDSDFDTKHCHRCGADVKIERPV